MIRATACSVTTRRATAEDLPPRRLRDRADELVWLLMPALLLGGAGGILGAALRWLLGRFGVAAPSLPRWSAAALLAIGLCVSAWLAARMRRARAATLREPIELLHVSDTRCVVSSSDRVPSVLFDLGGSRSLLVAGEALLDPFTFRDADGRRPGSRAPAGPGPFPSTEFVLHRGAQSGRIVRIDCRGTPLAPAGEVRSIARLLGRHVRLRDVKETLVVDVPFEAWTDATG